MPDDQPIAPPIAPPTIDEDRREVRVDAEGRIAEGIACHGCGYNVRGLLRDGLCPECSTPVEQSIKGDLLKFRNPAWLDRLARGLLIIIISLLVNVAVGILVGIGGAVVVGMTAGGGGGGTTMGTAMAIVMGAGAILALIVSMAIVYGVWLVTTPDPVDFETERPLSARRLARWGIFALIAGAPLQMLTQSAMGGGGMPGTVAFTPWFAVLAVVGQIVGIVVIVAQVAGLVYLGQLALRVPRPSLAKQTRVVAWGYGIVMALSAIVSVAMVIMMPMVMPGAGGGGGGGAGGAGGGAMPGLPFGVGFLVAAIGGCVVGVGTLVFGIWALVLLFISRNAFVKVASEAREQWSQPQDDRFSTASEPA